MSDSSNPPLAAQAAPKKNPYTLWFVVLSFVTPVAAAYLLYFFGDVKSFSNNGELLNPVADFQALQLSDAEQKRFTTESLEHKWHMLLFTRADCTGSCRDMLTRMHQINRAVGKHAYRLRHMVVHLQAPSPAFEKLLNTEFPRAIRTYGDAGVAQNALAPTQQAIDTNRVFLVDPLGNIMMAFDPALDPKLIIQDLKKLFKVSQIG